MAQTTGLTVRQHERAEFSFEVEFVVAPQFCSQVRFSATSAAQDGKTIRGLAQDISGGGMGMSFGLFLPRMCEGVVRVFDPKPVGTASDGTPIHDVAFEHMVKVRRVYLIDDGPTYSVGVSFVDAEPNLGERVEALMLLAGNGQGGSSDA